MQITFSATVRTVTFMSLVLLSVRAPNVTSLKQHSGMTIPYGVEVEYLHRSPASRRSDGKGTQYNWGYNWAALFRGDINTGT
jgi:hypothetical protein